MTRVHTRWALIGVPFTVALAVAGCSSSGSSSTSASTAASSGSSAASASGGAASSGSPVTVSMISQITASNFQSPETVGAAKGVVADINAHGGLGGHPINLITCDDKEDPTTAGNCARDAASQHAVAVVEGISLQGTTILPILQASQIPVVVSPTVPADYANPYAFPKDGGTVALYGGEGILLAKSDCKKVAIMYDSTNPVGATGGSQVKAGVLSAGSGAQVVASIGVPETSPNLTAAVAQVNSSGADCIGTAITPQQSIALFQAIGQSAKPDITVATIGPAMPPTVATQLGPLAKHMMLVNPEYLPSDPRAKPFVTDMQAGGVTNLSSFAQNVYIGFELLQQALKNHTGALTAADVKSALDSSSDLVVPTVPAPYQFSKPFPSPDYARITDLTMISYAFDGKNFTPLTGDRASIDATPALTRFVKGS